MSLFQEPLQSKEVVTGLQFEGKVRRSGMGDNWHITWAGDGYQYTALCDGFGWEEGPEYNTRVYRIKGDANDYTPEYLPGYPYIEIFKRWYGFGIISIDGTIYHFISWHPAGSLPPELGWNGARLVYSQDYGKSWKNCDGTTMKSERSKATSLPSVSCEPNEANMHFFNTPGRCFSIISILQYGKDYQDNSDGYVYLYSPNGFTEATMHQTVMARVLKTQIKNKNAYEYFVSCNTDGSVNWSSNINKRGVVNNFPQGWIAKNYPYSWVPFVVYIKALDIYLMAGAGTGKDGSDMFSNPSCLCFYTAPNPWGPWAEIYKNTAWMADGEVAITADTRIYNPVIAPKWISENGRAFTLIFTDGRNWGPPFDTPRPYYSFNTETVRLLTIGTIK